MAAGEQDEIDPLHGDQPPDRGVFTGFIITSIIQSSSATTVMLVSFVSAGLITLQQSVGIIFGANIGTTVTGWLVAIFGFKVKIAVFACKP
jgi:phosphate:Na+ symporter